METTGATRPCSILTLGELAAVVGGEAIGNRTVRIEGYAIDSRAIRAGELFIAIEGQRLDGNEFVQAALEKGACAALVARADALGESAGVVVDDTLQALQELGRYHRRRSGTRVVAITGSVGKTTTKELTAAVLESRFDVFRTKGNLNNHIGLPLSLLALADRPEVAVLELGMNAAGEISRLVELAEPDVRVWTNVAEVHAEFFPSVDAIADAKAEILEGATAETEVVANADDARVMSRVGRSLAKVTTFGFGPGAEVTAADIDERGLDGTSATIRTPLGEAQLQSSLPGRGNLANVLAAVAVGLRFAVSPEEAVARVASVTAAPGRGRLLRPGRGVVVVDDTYNASPLAVRTALAAFAGDPRPGRRIAVLGEMLELGSRALPLHRDTGRGAAAYELGLLLTVGGEAAEAMAVAAVEAGMPQGAVIYCEDREGAASVLIDRLEDGDVVLVKGSRGVRTEQVVARLEAECA